MEGDGVTIVNLVGTQSTMTVIVNETRIGRLEAVLVEVESAEEIVLGS